MIVTTGASDHIDALQNLLGEFLQENPTITVPNIDNLTPFIDTNTEGMSNTHQHN